MRNVYALAAKAALVILLLCLLTLIFVELGPAERVVTVLSAGMAGTVLAVSAIKLRKDEKKTTNDSWREKA